MTNKEYVLKYLNEHEDDLAELIDNYSCTFCGEIGLLGYCRLTGDNLSCAQTIKTWLSMEQKVGDSNA